MNNTVLRWKDSFANKHFMMWYTVVSDTPHVLVSVILQSIEMAVEDS